MSDTSDFFDALAGGAHDWKGQLAHDAAVDSPLWGAQPWRRFAASVSEWLRSQAAGAKVVASVSGPQRTVTEYVLHLDRGGEEIDLPVAVAFAFAGGKISSIRVYHSVRPFEGTHAGRKAILAPALGLAEPPIVKAYFHALERGDLKAILATFAADGSLCEPTGASSLHAGPKALEAYFGAAFRDGGIGVKHCSATFDGKLFAVEYACHRWGRAQLEPQAGAATFGLDLAGRHIATVRIYDDATTEEGGSKAPLA
jgi:ketosteroid isomerase-like protein